MPSPASPTKTNSGLFPVASGTFNDKNYTGEMRRRQVDLTASSSVGFQEEGAFFTPAGQHTAPVCGSCGAALLLRLLSSDEPLSAIDSMRKRRRRCFQISEPHPPAAHTFPLSLSLPLKSTQSASH